MLNRALPVLSFLLVALVATTAGAQPRPSWDSRGWVLLGEREVNGHGREDHDRVEVGRAEGRFNKLTLVVEDADMELINMRVVFRDNTDFDPRSGHYFREGQRTRVIDLPAGEHVIRYIDFTYRNLPGRGHAKVAVWGNKISDAPPPPPPPPPAPVWDSRGWTLLGERQVNGHGREDRDRIEVGRVEGRFSKLTVLVENADLEMIDMSVTFAGGPPFHPTVNQYFREGTRTRVIDLPGDTRVIRSIDFTYRNIPGGGRARVAVYGLQGAPPPPPPPAPVVWESRGWTMLGERTVNGHGREDTDRIEVGRYEGRFAKMTIVVQDSDLEMIDLSVKFERGAPWHPATSHFFREGQRTHVIDFPGDERRIRWIEFRYRNIPGQGHAKVQVWARP